MVTAARTASQITAHMAIAFAITYIFTGSFVFGGLAAMIEPVLNVSLLPLHERVWCRIRNAMAHHSALLMLGMQKFSQTILHMLVAFAVIAWATGSFAFGGLAALLEPVCNVLLLPFHDRLWTRIQERWENNRADYVAAI